MKPTEIKMRVLSDAIATIGDPQHKGHDVIHAYVKLSDLARDLPMDVNPRAQNTRSRVAREIAGSLLNQGESFHLLNRGLTVSAYESDYDPRKQQLTLKFTGENYGLLDGGHTYRVIQENLEQSPDAFVKLEVLTRIKPSMLVDLARARNTSAQVRDESLANLEGKFDWIKELLDKETYGGLIAYRENEDDEKFPIDIREIIALMTLFLPQFEETENPPIIAYASKAKVLDLYRNDPSVYEKMRGIVPDVLKLYDYLHLSFASTYQEIGGFRGLDEQKGKGVRLGNVVEVRQVKSGFPLYYTGETAHYRFPDGWLYPALSALRALVSYKYHGKWKVNPYKFWDKYGKRIVAATLKTSRDMGRNPNAVGKERSHWIQLHSMVTGMFAKLAGVDLDKTVEM